MLGEGGGGEGGTLPKPPLPKFVQQNEVQWNTNICNVGTVFENFPGLYIYNELHTRTWAENVPWNFSQFLSTINNLH